MVEQSQELTRGPIDVLTIPSELDISHIGTRVLYNTSHRPWTYDPEIGRSRPPQSWEASTHDIKQGHGVYLTAVDGSWHIKLFSFNEDRPPSVDDFELSKWDWKSFGATEDHKDWFTGSLRVAKYCESASMHIAAFGSPDLKHKSEDDATHRGEDILIYSGKANGWNSGPTVGGGKMPRPLGKFMHITTQLFPDTEGVVELFDRITHGRLSDGDRALVWVAVEEQLNALHGAKLERETFLAGLHGESTDGGRSALDGLAALVKEVKGQ